MPMLASNVSAAVATRALVMTRSSKSDMRDISVDSGRWC
jgi:hypothetical protein